MAMTARPRRSVLYMPASRASALEKARSLPADVLIFDLEDAVAPDAKADARAAAVAAAGSGSYGPREIVIRANGLDTPWGRDDLAAAATSGAHAVLLPKIESPVELRRADAVLRAAGAPDDLAVWVMIETPLGVLNVREIAGAGGRLDCLVLGTSDLAKDLTALHTPDRVAFLPALSLALMAARAYGLTALDGVHLDLADEDGFAAACAQGRTLGFDGKTLIHPRQVEAANRAFAPAEEEVAFARRVIEAHAAAEAEGKGVVLVDGRLIENLHVEMAHRTIALAEAIAARG